MFNLCNFLHHFTYAQKYSKMIKLRNQLFRRQWHCVTVPRKSMGYSQKNGKFWKKKIGRITVNFFVKSVTNIGYQRIPISLTNIDVTAWLFWDLTTMEIWYLIGTIKYLLKSSIYLNCHVETSKNSSQEFFVIQTTYSIKLIENRSWPMTNGWFF